MRPGRERRKEKRANPPLHRLSAACFTAVAHRGMSPWLDNRLINFTTIDRDLEKFSEETRAAWREQQAFDLVNNIGPGVDEFTDWEK